MLQVVDEIDDAIGALRLCYLGWAAEIGLVWAGAPGAANPYRRANEHRTNPTPL